MSQYLIMGFPYPKPASCKSKGQERQSPDPQEYDLVSADQGQRTGDTSGLYASV